MAGYFQTLVDSMPWSWSRLNAFDDCKYGWYLKYIRGFPGNDHKFFSGFGSLMHEILERYLARGVSKDMLVLYYLQNFREKTDGETPKLEMRAQYFDNGLSYIKSLEPFPFKPIAVEQRVSCDLNGKRFVGVIDCLAEDEDGLAIVDHKSRRLKPYSGRKRQTESDRELDHYLMQLYLYAFWVKQKYGEFPKSLIFNCFRDGRLIKAQFDKQKYEQTVNWADEKIAEIRDTEDFPPNIEFFKCKYLCDMSDHCEYYQANFGKE